MKRAGVIGDPVSHSLSPLIHSHWLAACGIKGCYIPLHVKARDLKKTLRRLVAEGYAGVNVTLPHKESVIKLADVVSVSAQRMRAANTLVFKKGLVYADNTDGLGFLENLKLCLPRLDLRGRTVTVLGAGGAARGICFALLDAGVTSFHIVNRDIARARGLGRDLLRAGAQSIDVFSWTQPEKFLADTALLINASSLGMTGQPALKLDLRGLPKTAVVCDIVYRPLMTDLLRRANARGHRVVTGLGMLVAQARPGFAAWFGKNPQVTAALMKKLEATL